MKVMEDFIGRHNGVSTPASNVDVKIVTVTGNDARHVTAAGGMLALPAPTTMEPTIFVTQWVKRELHYKFALRRSMLYFHKGYHLDVKRDSPHIWGIMEKSRSVSDYSEDTATYLHSLSYSEACDFLDKAYGEVKIEQEMELDRLTSNTLGYYQTCAMLESLESSLRSVGHSENPFVIASHNVLKMRVFSLREKIAKEFLR